MLMKYIDKTKYFFNLILPFVLLFQWTLPTIEKKNLQLNFGDLIYQKCDDPEHSHPPLSQKKSSNDQLKFVNTEANNIFFVSKPPKFFNISGENKFQKFTTLPKLVLASFPPARGPPYLEV